jgi:transposase InsO family protein
MPVGHAAVETLMRRAGLQGQPGNRHRRRKPIPDTPPADDLVNRVFDRDRHDQLWVTDITEHHTREGKVYCTVVLDTYSAASSVGPSTPPRPQPSSPTPSTWPSETEKPTTANGLIIHSDHGVQFTSWAFTHRARASGLVPSMGSIGDCYDNAMIESFWGRMQALHDPGCSRGLNPPVSRSDLAM